MVKIDETVAGQHDIEIHAREFQQGLQVALFVEINRAVPAKIAVAERANDIAGEDQALAFRLHGKSRTTHRVAGQVDGFDVDATQGNDLTVLDGFIDFAGDELFVVKKATAAFVAGLNGISGFGVGDEPDAALLQQMRSAGVIPMRMGDETGADGLRGESPVFHVGKYLFQRFAVAAVKKEQLLLSLQDVDISIVKRVTLVCMRQAGETAPDLKKVMKNLQRKSPENKVGI